MLLVFRGNKFFKISPNYIGSLRILQTPTRA